MNTIQAMWASYEAGVIPADAGATQRTECRRAFYAGAQAMLGTFWNLGSMDVTEDAGVAVIEGMHQEAQAFAGDVLAGRA